MIFHDTGAYSLDVICANCDKNKEVEHVMTYKFNKWNICLKIDSEWLQSNHKDSVYVDGNA